MVRDSTIKNPESTGIEWLDPSDVRMYRDAAGNVRATVKGVCSVLRPALLRAFPITQPGAYVELRETDGASIGMMKELSPLDEESRRVADTLLQERYMIPAITAIHSLRQELGSWMWEVDTDRGSRTFAVRKPRECIHTLPDISEDGRRIRRIRVTDVDGNTYEIRDYDALDPRSRAFFDRVG